MKDKPNTSDSYPARTESMTSRTESLAGSAAPKITVVPPERIEWLKRYSNSLRVDQGY